MAKLAIGAERTRSRASDTALSGSPTMAKAGQAGRDLHLHVDRAGLDPLKGYGGNALDHAAPLPQRKVAESRWAGKNIRGTSGKALGVSLHALSGLAYIRRAGRATNSEERIAMVTQRNFHDENSELFLGALRVVCEGEPKKVSLCHCLARQRQTLEASKV